MTRVVKIKICGITNKEDAEKLAQLDVDALGFIVTKKQIPSRISVKDAKKIIAKLPPFVVSVLSGGQGIDEVVSLCEEIKPNSLQIQYGLDRLNELKKLKKRLPWVKIIKVIHVDLERPDKKEVLKKARKFIKVADSLLIHPVRREYKTPNLKKYWQIARMIVKSSPKPVILAGNLDVQNAAEAIKTVKPYAIDLIKGVESEPGKKDFKKVKKLIKIVKATVI